MKVCRSWEENILILFFKVDGNVRFHIGSTPFWRTKWQLLLHHSNRNKMRLMQREGESKELICVIKLALFVTWQANSEWVYAVHRYIDVHKSES
ncbi:hypothetical protein KPH14_010659 [Odynerus spinipes]|uniref:Uncharacterized protein n=1 Tax=Odynerus spinipes TaxID=1348599 RepID=A0AAD9VTP5_9HYME|nr:hypothetical protein KPH14_010659 [Odynerus spinipes]